MIVMSPIFHIFQRFNSMSGIWLIISCDRFEYHMRESLNLTSNSVTCRLVGKTSTVNNKKDESCHGTSPQYAHVQHRNDKSKLLADQFCHAINGSIRPEQVSVQLCVGAAFAIKCWLEACANWHLSQQSRWSAIRPFTLWHAWEKRISDKSRRLHRSICPTIFRPFIVDTKHLFRIQIGTFADSELSEHAIHRSAVCPW